MDCLYCHSDQLQKNGKLASGGQRWKCGDCHKQFSQGGARDTYSPEFKEQVVRHYRHDHSKAKEITSQYAISSKTLIEWSKEHKKTCLECGSD